MATLLEQMNKILENDVKAVSVDRRQAIKELVEFYKNLTADVVSKANLNTSENANRRSEFLADQTEAFVEDITALAAKLNTLLVNSTPDRRRHFADDMLAVMANFSDDEIIAWYTFEQETLTLAAR